MTSDSKENYYRQGAYDNENNNWDFLKSYNPSQGQGKFQKNKRQPAGAKMSSGINWTRRKNQI